MQTKDTGKLADRDREKENAPDREKRENWQPHMQRSGGEQRPGRGGEEEEGEAYESEVCVVVMHLAILIQYL